MRKIHNAYADLGDYNCFGCSPSNSIGLQLQFAEDGEWITSKWTPKKQYEGYMNMLHGGIQATLLDEIADWVLIAKLKTSGVIKNLNINYLKPVFLSQGEITLRAKIKSQEGRSAIIYTELLDKDGDIRSHADIEYFVYPQEIARKKYNFPNPEDFFKEKE